jgi:hypothetical protein
MFQLVEGTCLPKQGGNFLRASDNHAAHHKRRLLSLFATSACAGRMPQNSKSLQLVADGREVLEPFLSD